jgi:hypothetical protein
MMLRPTLLLLIVSSLLYQSGGAKKEEQPEAYTDPDAYEVYNAILTSQRRLENANAKLFFIPSLTQSEKMCLAPDKESQKIIGSAISDYEKKNEKAWLLQPLLNVELRYQLIPPEELQAARELGMWSAYFAKHPNADNWIELSAVGFNEDKTVAVAYMRHLCGMMCGDGHFHVLQKKDGKWMPLEWKGSQCVWNS